MNKNKVRTIVSLIILYIGLFILSSVGGYLYMYFHDINHTQQTAAQLKDRIVDVPVEDDDATKKNLNDSDGGALTPRERASKAYAELLEENSDFIGWLEVPDTNIDYPVMYTPNDEEYYLRRDFYKKYDISGTLFCNKACDPEKPSNNIVIYGHHMRAGTMFQNLTKFKDKEFYDEHKTFYFDTIYRTGTYEVIAVVYTDVNAGAFKYWEVEDTEEAFNEYVNFLKRKTVYNTDGLDSVTYGDKLVTMSTCAYHVTNGRLIVVGKLIDSDDKEVLNINN